MSIVTGYVEVSRVYKKTHPSLHYDKGWFGHTRCPQSISLNGGRVNSVEFGSTLRGVSQEKMRSPSFLARFPYWESIGEIKGLDAYRVYLGFITFDDAQKAFQIPRYELGRGVILHLNSMSAAEPTEFKEARPI